MALISPLHETGRNIHAPSSLPHAASVRLAHRGDADQRWCGGVDEKARVWLNGTPPLGISHGASFYPFELDATGAVKPGQPNVVTICVANELGTGGIVAPVLLCAPASGKVAKLDNFRPLGRTFP